MEREQGAEGAMSEIDPLAAAGRDVRDAVYDAQRGMLSRVQGKRVLRMGREWDVERASRRGGVKLVGPGGEAVTMTAKSFLSRGVHVLVPDPALKGKAPAASVADRARGIAAANGLTGEQKMLRLAALKRGASNDDRAAVDWYMDQVRQGRKPPRPWPGRED